MNTRRVDQATEVTDSDQLVDSRKNDDVAREQKPVSPEVGQFFLRISDGLHDSYTRALSDGETVIGRSPKSCKIVVYGEAVSRSHCTITVRNSVVKVKDNSSLNGTFVDELRITEEILELEQVVRMGPVRMILCQRT